MIVKVCGLRDIDNLSQIDDLVGVDMIGFNFYKPSPRFVDPTSLLGLTDLHCKSVGVFVDERLDILMNIRGLLNLDYVQLHGHESVSYIRECRAVTKIIKVIGVENKDDLNKATDMEYCDYLLFDKKSPEFGGTGKKFDWALLTAYSGSIPFILAGGIALDDVEKIKAIDHPKFAGVDINSKFEISPAMKDITLIKQFVKALKS
jgi:phosphoribosylanthranilate isomerase